MSDATTKDAVTAKAQPQVPQQAAAPTQESLPMTPAQRWYRRPVVVWPAVVALVAGILVIAWLAGPGTYTLKGSITLTSSSNVSNSYSGCSGDGGYSDMHQGATVTIYDATGQTVAMAPLQAGRSASTSSTYYPYSTSSCAFAFEVPGVPDDSANYTVEIGNRGKMTYAAEAAKTGQIALSLSS